MYNCLGTRVCAYTLQWGNPAVEYTQQNKTMNKTPYTHVCVLSTVNAIPDK